MSQIKSLGSIRKAYERKPRVLVSDQLFKSLLIILIGALMGFGRLWIYNESKSTPDPTLLGTCATVYGEVVDYVEIDSDKQKIVLNIKEYRGLKSQEIYDLDSKVIIFAPLFPLVKKSQIVKVEGCFEEPFSEGYRTYLSQRGIHMVISRAYSLEIIDSKLSLGVRIREIVKDSVEQIFWEPYAALILGMTCGITSSMPKRFSSALQITGTTHLIAVSGFNVTLISNSVTRLLLKAFSRRQATLISIAALWFFVSFIGMQPPVLRAGIMSTFVLMGSLLGRPVYQEIGFIVSIVIMLLYNPLYLVSISFQLSVLATAGLLFLVPILRKALYFIPKILDEAITVGLAANLTTLPVISYNFGVVSIITLLANSLVGFIVEFITLFGFLNIFIGMFSVSLAKLMSWVTWIPLKYFVFVVETLGEIRWAQVDFKITNLGMGLYYLVMIIILLIFS
jgi:competence protein ComEC